MKNGVSITLMFILISMGAIAQQECSLQGKWNVEFVGEKEKAIYEIKKVDDKLKGYAILWIDEDGKKYADQSLVLNNITWNGQKGKADYKLEYKGDILEMEAKFEKVTKDKIKVSYSYWGYKGEEIWIRNHSH